MKNEQMKVKTSRVSVNSPADDAYDEKTGIVIFAAEAQDIYTGRKMVYSLSLSGSIGRIEEVSMEMNLRNNIRCSSQSCWLENYSLPKILKEVENMIKRFFFSW